MPKYNIIRLTFSLLQFTIPKFKRRLAPKSSAIVLWGGIGDGFRTSLFMNFGNANRPFR